MKTNKDVKKTFEYKRNKDILVNHAIYDGVCSFKVDEC